MLRLKRNEKGIKLAHQIKEHVSFHANAKVNKRKKDNAITSWEMLSRFFSGS